MSRFTSKSGIRSYRKAATLIAGSTLLFGSGAQASEAPSASQASPAAESDAANSAAAVTAAAATAAEAADAADPVVVTGERYRINTLNSRLRDVREAPQTISIIPR